MSVQNELNAALYSTLTGGTALTSLLAGTTSVYFLQAPEDATLPYVVYSYQAGGAENVTPSDMRSQLVYTRGYASTPALAGSIDAQISSLLHRQTLSVSGWANFWTAREEDFILVENPPDKSPIYMSGASYRIRLT